MPRVAIKGDIMPELADVLSLRVCLDALQKPLYGLHCQMPDVLLICSND